MSIFHCPMGAPYMNGEDCVNCGLCIARTKQDYLAASKILREKLKEKVSNRLDKYKIQKIAVCGKGGAGKSTVTSFLAQGLTDLGYKVLVIDTDESNAGLYKKLGLKKTGKPLITVLGNGFSDYENADTEWLRPDEIKLSDIPQPYLVRKGRLGLLTTGKIQDPFQGCACTMSDIVRDLLIKLKLQEGQIIVVDNEAGIESFGRGLERGADTVINVVEPSFDSIEMAGRIKYMSEGIGIGRVRAILNKIPSEEIEKLIIDELWKQEIKYLGTIFQEPAILNAGLFGRQVENEVLKEKAKQIVKLMLDEAEMKYLKEVENE